MGVTSNAIFGDVPRAEPATPGTYGEAPSGFRLPAATRLGPVRLVISDLARSLDFYENVLGLRVMQRESSRAILAPFGEDRSLVELIERSGVRPVPHRGRLGLFHFAILLPDRASLGRFVRHLADTKAQAGAADHLVSEAFYLQDPDNLGIEIYADRPRTEWKRIGRELMMATDPVDVASLVQAAGGAPWSGIPAGTTMGHVHLHVGAIEPAKAFYSEAVGLDRTVWHYPGALFLGAGGYHHHLGTNTWAGAGARPPTDGDARLLEWTIELPDTASVMGLAASLAAGSFPVEQHAGDLVTRDPWSTQLRVRVFHPHDATGRDHASTER
ncbi:MAG TPA: VOC family protein [Gemmatimonadaceae bacterium]